MHTETDLIHFCTIKMCDIYLNILIRPSGVGILWILPDNLCFVSLVLLWISRQYSWFSECSWTELVCITTVGRYELFFWGGDIFVCVFVSIYWSRKLEKSIYSTNTFGCIIFWFYHQECPLGSAVEFHNYTFFAASPRTYNMLHELEGWVKSAVIPWVRVNKDHYPVEYQSLLLAERT